MYSCTLQVVENTGKGCEADFRRLKSDDRPDDFEKNGLGSCTESLKLLNKFL